MKKFLLAFFVLFTININVHAASLCSYEEQTNLNSKAANVKVSYEVVEETVEFEDMDVISKVFDISIFNITEEFYVVVKNNINDQEKTYRYSDTNNGIVKFRWKDLEDVTNFTFQIFTTEKTNCPDEKFKTLYLTAPRYNPYSRYSICSQLEDFYLCEEFVTFSKIDEDEFINKVEKYQKEELKTNNNEKVEENKENEKPTKMTDEIFNFFDNYKWYIVGGLIIVLVVLIIINRKKLKKQRDLGL